MSRAVEAWHELANRQVPDGAGNYQSNFSIDRDALVYCSAMSAFIAGWYAHSREVAND